MTAEQRARNALLKAWKQEDAQQQFRINYPHLNEESVVFDLGGYQGQWASDIFARYQCSIHIFEPHPNYVAYIKVRFKQNAKLKVYDFGLGAKTEQVLFSTQADATSQYLSDGEQVEVQLKNISSFLDHQTFRHIHLMKINIEGGEYELLEYLLTSGWIFRIEQLQIQFHHFIPNAKVRMQAIHLKLAQTHELTYQFEFFWENWKLKQ